MSAALIISTGLEMDALLAAADYSGALAKAIVLQGIMARTPDIRHGSEEIRYSMNGVGAQILWLRRMAGAPNGVRMQTVTYTRPGATGDYL